MGGGRAPHRWWRGIRQQRVRGLFGRCGDSLGAYGSVLATAEWKRGAAERHDSQQGSGDATPGRSTESLLGRSGIICGLAPEQVADQEPRCDAVRGNHRQQARSIDRKDFRLRCLCSRSSGPRPPQARQQVDETRLRGHGAPCQGLPTGRCQDGINHGFARRRL